MKHLTTFKIFTILKNLSIMKAIRYNGVKYIVNLTSFSKGPKSPYLNKKVLQIIANKQQIVITGKMICRLYKIFLH
jgi:hypothetical protein